MSDERRRYFRISDTVGITYQRIDRGDDADKKNDELAPDAVSRLFEHDDKIKKLIGELRQEDPKTAQLIQLFNQKIDRIANLMVLRNDLVNRIAHRVKEVNISACGMAFLNDEPIAEGERLRLELQLLPAETRIHMLARVVSCDPEAGTAQYYWRLDFYSMSVSCQETLIQHIVRSQSAQLKGNRKT